MGTHMRERTAPTGTRRIPPRTVLRSLTFRKFHGMIRAPESCWPPTLEFPQPTDPVDFATAPLRVRMDCIRPLPAAGARAAAPRGARQPAALWAEVARDTPSHRGSRSWVIPRMECATFPMFPYLPRMEFGGTTTCFATPTPQTEAQLARARRAAGPARAELHSRPRSGPGSKP